MGGRFWTEYEKAWLSQAWPKTGIPAEAIAYALKRTVSAIQGKAQRLEIKRPWVGSPEHEEHLKRLHETWSGSPENLEGLNRMRMKAQETWVGSPEHNEQLTRLQETWVGSSENLETLKRLHETWNGSFENLEVLKRARKKLRVKPSLPEAVFYGLVYGYDGLAKEFHAQECIPTNTCNHTVDGRWRDTIFELDGGGHNVYRDVTEHDLLVDAEYRAMGYQVIREETASELFLRFLQVIETEEPLKDICCQQALNSCPSIG